MNMSGVGGQPSKYMKTWLAYSVSMEASPIILCKGFLHHLICLHRVCFCWIGTHLLRAFWQPIQTFAIWRMVLPLLSLLTNGVVCNASAADCTQCLLLLYCNEKGLTKAWVFGKIIWEESYLLYNTTLSKCVSFMFIEEFLLYFKNYTQLIFGTHCSGMWLFTSMKKWDISSHHLRLVHDLTHYSKCLKKLWVVPRGSQPKRYLVVLNPS